MQETGPGRIAVQDPEIPCNANDKQDSRLQFFDDDDLCAYRLTGVPSELKTSPTQPEFRMAGSRLKTSSVGLLMAEMRRPTIVQSAPLGATSEEVMIGEFIPAKTTHVASTPGPATPWSRFQGPPDSWHYPQLSQALIGQGVCRNDNSHGPGWNQSCSLAGLHDAFIFGNNAWKTALPIYPIMMVGRYEGCSLPCSTHREPWQFIWSVTSKTVAT